MSSLYLRVQELASSALVVLLFGLRATSRGYMSHLANWSIFVCCGRAKHKKRKETIKYSINTYIYIYIYIYIQMYYLCICSRNMCPKPALKPEVRSSALVAASRLVPPSPCRAKNQGILGLSALTARACWGSGVYGPRGSGPY